MDYEKKYKEALELARVAAFNGHQSLMEGIFPELKESEDEKIRKELIDIVAKSPITFAFEDKNKVLSWLEKQGEQKPANKIKPKFRVGDWVVSPNGVYWHIDAIQNGRYEVTADTGQCGNWPLDTNIYRLWTIQDAKDGDVLTNGDFPCIFKRCDDNGSLYVYCGINAHNDFSILSEDPENVWDDYSKQYFPATKEQRDTLFAKMKESGYEWLEETKELKKIEQESAKWNEEDEHRVKDTIYFLETAKKHYASTVELGACIDWLKSLKDRYTWKPSDEQLEFLQKCIEAYNEVTFPTEVRVLSSLYNDLKKLRGE